MRSLKLPNIKKDELAVSAISRLRAILPKPEEIPKYILVDDDIYESLKNQLSGSAIKADFLLLDSWMVIRRSMVYEIG